MEKYFDEQVRLFKREYCYDCKRSEKNKCRKNIDHFATLHLFKIHLNPK